MRKYTTIQGDTWDKISFNQFGDVKYTDTLMNANTKYRDIYIFSAGVEIDLPDVETITASKTLPPWKRVSG